MPTSRSSLAQGVTFVRFALQQIVQRGRVAGEIATASGAPFAFDAATHVIRAGGTAWHATNLRVSKGQRFALSARGEIWFAKPLGVVMEPRSTLWVRIAGHDGIAKPVANDHVFTAWADGEVELLVKAGSEWASHTGALLPGPRPAMAGEIGVRVAATQAPATQTDAPADWRYLWRLGDGSIYRPGDGNEIEINTHGDVGILQLDVDHAITPATRLDWSWRVDSLPSRLPEDIMLTHDYLSVAVEFEDGKDLTFMWSSGLPHDHIFTCPLNYWCDRETHWVLRTPRDGLQTWHTESRALWNDTQTAYGARPAKAVRLWLIANSVFQRNVGLARIRDLKLREA